MSLFAKKKSQESVPRRRSIDTSRVRTELRDEESWTYRRNRTLTGSLSSRVSSASENRADLKSPRTHAHDLTRLRRKIGGIFLGTVLICGSLGVLLYNFVAEIHVVPSDGAAALDEHRYQQSVEAYFGQHPVERFRPLLNHERMNEFVTHQLPEVASIALSSNSLDTGTFTVTLRKPIASWMINTTQYYVDAAGVPFQINYFAPPSVKVVDRSGVQETTGMAVVSTQFLRFVGQAVAVATREGLTIQQVSIPPQTIRQVEVTVEGHAYPVKLSLDRPVGEQVEDMQRAIKYLDEKQIVPQYVDVRVSGKAFYK